MNIWDYSIDYGYVGFLLFAGLSVTVVHFFLFVVYMRYRYHARFVTIFLGVLCLCVLISVFLGVLFFRPASEPRVFQFSYTPEFNPRPFDITPIDTFNWGS